MIALESPDLRGPTLDGRTVLVTGASGFIGTRLCERLCREGADVHAASRDEHADKPGGPRWHGVDLVDADAVRELVQSLKPDTVFHLASNVSGDPRHQLVRPMLESNLLATVSLLTAVQEAGCRRMVMTGSVVEPSPGEVAVSPYAAAKAAATDHARMFYSLYGTPVVCLRLAMVYGPGQGDPRKLIPHVVTSLMRGEAPRISSGRWEVDWIYVDDVVQALIQATLADDIGGQALDVGTSDVATVRDIVEQLADVVGNGIAPEVGVVEDRPLERSVSANLEETHNLLGWAPTTSLREGLRKTVAWYR